MSVDWTDMTEIERVAKAIRDAKWQMIHPTKWSRKAAPPSQAYADTLPLTKQNLAAAEAAIKALDEFRREIDGRA